MLDVGYDVKLLHRHTTAKYFIIIIMRNNLHDKLLIILVICMSKVLSQTKLESFSPFGRKRESIVKMVKLKDDYITHRYGCYWHGTKGYNR